MIRPEAVMEKPATETAYSALVQKQRDFFWSHATKPIAFRKKQLRNLKAAFAKHEESLLAALKKDLNKPRQEAFTTELGITVAEIDHIIRHLEDWMEPEVHITDITEITGSFKVYVLEDISWGRTVWDNGILVSAGTSFEYLNPKIPPSSLTGSHEEKREYQVNLKSRTVGAASHERLKLFQQVDDWDAADGDIIEYYEKLGSLE